VAKGEVFGRPLAIPKSPPPTAEPAIQDQASWEKRELVRLEKLESRTEADNALLSALIDSGNERSKEQSKLVEDAFAKASATARRQRANPDIADLMVWKDLDKPRETYIYLRGDFLRPDKETGLLNPGVPAAVGPKLGVLDGRIASEETTRTRLDLARWLVHPENPLTPRVQMNRAWMRLFGRGLVETEEDFGTQGTPPTHPELLDWLAGEWIRRGWSLKDMVRLVVTSRTYRQSSHFRADLRDRDPRNLLLARQDRVRLDAEIVRDAALSASGLLTRTIGGPSVKPPQPEGVYAFTQTQKKWTADTGGNRYRRGMYTLFFRSAPHPLFTTFDAPDFQTVCTRRGRSNTPLQALNVANDETFLEFARGLAARVIRETPQAKSEVRIRYAFVFALSREPSPNELAALCGYYARQHAELSVEVDRVQALLAEQAPSEDGVSDASLTLVCRAILNTDSFISRE
jgi:hypothetical protein